MNAVKSRCLFYFTTYSNTCNILASIAVLVLKVMEQQVIGEFKELQVRRDHLETVIYTLQRDYRMYPWNSNDKEQNSLIMVALKGQLSLIQDDIDNELTS